LDIHGLAPLLSVVRLWTPYSYALGKHK